MKDAFGKPVTLWPARRVVDGILCGAPDPRNADGYCHGWLGAVVWGLDGDGEAIDQPDGLKEVPPGSGDWFETERSRDQRERGQRATGPGGRGRKVIARPIRPPYTQPCRSCGRRAHVPEGIVVGGAQRG